MNDELDRTIAEGLRRRADAMPVSPLGFGDVQHRIARTRQRTATFAAAAVMVPAVAGLAYLVGHRGEETVSLGSPAGVPSTMLVPGPTTTYGEFPYGYRCQSLQSQDEVWSYYAYCEPVGVGEPMVPMTTMYVTVPPEFAPTTAIEPLDMLFGGQLLVVDATGGLPIDQILASRGINQYDLLAGQRVVEQTMIMPIGDDPTLATRLADLVPVGGFDTWDSSLIDGPAPDGVTAVLVLGADALDYFAPATTIPGVYCPPASFDLPPAPSSTFTGQPTTTTLPAPTTTVFLPPTTTIC